MFKITEYTDIHVDRRKDVRAYRVRRFYQRYYCTRAVINRHHVQI